MKDGGGNSLKSKTKTLFYPLSLKIEKCTLGGCIKVHFSRVNFLTTITSFLRETLLYFPLTTCKSVPTWLAELVRNNFLF